MSSLSLEDRLQRLLSALFSNAAEKSNHRNRGGSSAPCLRKRTSLSNSDNPFCHPAKTVWSPLRATIVESYSTPRQSGPVLARHVTTRGKCRILSPTTNNQHPLFFYFTLPLFHQPGCGACSSLSHIAASLAQSSDRMGIFFFWSFVEEPRGYAKGRKREIKKTAQCRVLIIFVIVPEPVER